MIVKPTCLEAQTVPGVVFIRRLAADQWEAYVNGDTIPAPQVQEPTEAQLAAAAAAAAQAAAVAAFNAQLAAGLQPCDTSHTHAEYAVTSHNHNAAYSDISHTHAAQTSVSGNAGTATALQNARTINGVSFNGTANITVPALPQTGAMGYATGAGGTVTQATSKATAVTLNKLCGDITTNAAALAAAATVTFVVNNNAVAAGDLVMVMHQSVGAASYTITPNTVGAGVFSISIRNNTAGSLAQVLVIRFAVFKAALA